MRKLRNKLLLSILTVALTFIALGTTTFAWFTLGGSATANAFEAQVTTPDGIEFSFDGKEWSNSLDLTEQVSENLRFIDITSADGLAFDTKADNGEIVAGDSYFTAKIYIRTTNSDTTINLSKVDFTETVISWTPDVDLTYGEDVNWTKGGTAVEFAAVNAIRVSFNDGANTKVVAIEGEKSHGAAALDGLAKAYAQKKGYTIDSTLSTAPATPAATVENADEIAEEDRIAVVASGQFSATAPQVEGFIDADGYNYATLKINVWLEGWDADCINAILSGQVKLGFTFKAAFAGTTIE